MAKKKWDVFISHASEDKNTVVRELATILQNIGVSTWYDETTLVVGDSLSSQIDEGLKESNFGIIIISKSFLKKKWTDYEYRLLLSKEENFKKVILPIWHDITFKDVKKFSLYLADKFALSTSINSLLSIAFQLTEVIKPEIYLNFHRIMMNQKVVLEGKTYDVEIGKLHPGPKKREALPGKLITRIKAIRKGIGQHFECTLEEDIDCYLRDNNPESEVEIWETLNASYYDFIEKTLSIKKLKRKLLLNCFLSLHFQKLNILSYPTTILSNFLKFGNQTATCINH